MSAAAEAQVNVYGETLAHAQERVRRVAPASDITPCVWCRDDFEQAICDLRILNNPGPDDFSLDGIDQISWTIMADVATEAASRVTTCAETHEA